MPSCFRSMRPDQTPYIHWLDRYGATNVAQEGKLVFSFSIGTTADEFSVTISDNGDGLNEKNYAAFLTPFTGNKLRRGGKGFGRFVAFKVFEEISYYSKSEAAESQVEIRSFDFSIYADEEIIETTGGIPPEFPTGCAVSYRRVKPQYHKRWEEITEERILDHLSSNFLIYLVDGRMPDTTVVVGDKDVDLRSHFARVFRHEKTHTLSVELRGTTHELKCDVSRVRARQTVLSTPTDIFC